MSFIVGLYSPTPGAGKSTVADELIRAGFIRLKFASGLKRMIQSVLEEQNVPASEISRMLEGDLKETPTTYLSGRTPRYAMQTLGTEWGRDLIHQDIWLNILQQKIDNNKTQPIVIDDLRFPNEYRFLKSQKSQVLLVKILSVQNTDVIHTHVSEGSLSDVPFDLVVNNDRTKFTAKTFAEHCKNLIYRSF